MLICSTTGLLENVSAERPSMASSRTNLSFGDLVAQLGHVFSTVFFSLRGRYLAAANKLGQPGVGVKKMVLRYRFPRHDVEVCDNEHYIPHSLGIVEMRPSRL